MEEGGAAHTEPRTTLLNMKKRNHCLNNNTSSIPFSPLFVTRAALQCLSSPYRYSCPRHHLRSDAPTPILLKLLPPTHLQPRRTGLRTIHRPMFRLQSSTQVAFFRLPLMGSDPRLHPSKPRERVLQYSSAQARGTTRCLRCQDGLHIPAREVVGQPCTSTS